MATQNDVRTIALALDGVTESPDDFTFFVDSKHFIWLWKERIDPKKPRVPNPRVIAVSVASDIDKRVLLAMEKEVFFTEPHYDGYNAVLVRLPRISRPLLRQIVTQGWEARRSRSPAPRQHRASAARPSRPARRRRA